MAKLQNSLTQRPKASGQGKRKPGQKAVVVQIAPQTRTVKGQGPSRSIQQELVLPVVAGPSQFLLHPSTIPWLGVVAQSHQDWCLAGLKIWYEPRVGTTTAGTVSAGIIEDFTDSNPSSLASITRLTGSKRGAPWTPFVLSAPKSRWVPYVNRAGFDAMDVTDKMTRSLGRIVVFADSDFTGTLGNIFISYDPTKSLRNPTDPALQASITGPTPLADLDFVYNETYASATVGQSTNVNFLGRPNLDFGSVLYIDQVWTDSVSGVKTTRRSLVNPNTVTVYVALNIFFQNGYSRVSSNDFNFYYNGTGQLPSFFTGNSGYDLTVTLYAAMQPGTRMCITAVREQLVNTGFNIAISDKFAAPNILTAVASASVPLVTGTQTTTTLPAPKLITETLSWAATSSSTDAMALSTVNLPIGMTYDGQYLNNVSNSLVHTVLVYVLAGTTAATVTATNKTVTTTVVNSQGVTAGWVSLEIGQRIQVYPGTFGLYQGNFAFSSTTFANQYQNGGAIG